MRQLRHCQKRYISQRSKERNIWPTYAKVLPLGDHLTPKDQQKHRSSWTICCINMKKRIYYSFYEHTMKIGHIMNVIQNIFMKSSIFLMSVNLFLRTLSCKTIQFSEKRNEHPLLIPHVTVKLWDSLLIGAVNQLNWRKMLPDLKQLKAQKIHVLARAKVISTQKGEKRIRVWKLFEFKATRDILKPINKEVWETI